MLITKSESGARKVWYALQRLGIVSVVSRQRNRGFKEGHIFRVIVRGGVEDLRKFYESVPLNNAKRRRHSRPSWRTGRSIAGTMFIVYQFQAR